ncbi:MAG: hypothetical protein JXB30_19630 [Anaerolineae bacterium]|nr:hypothetical protein [Anaerolineae bacterium]
MISQRVYKMLLWLYPAPFRKEYGSLMVQLFADRLRDASRRGTSDILWLWLHTLIDLIFSAIQEYSDMFKQFTVNKPLFLLGCIPLGFMVFAWFIWTMALRDLLGPWTDVLALFVVGAHIVTFYLLFRRVGMLAKLSWYVAGLNLLFFVVGYLVGMLPGGLLMKVFVSDLSDTSRITTYVFVMQFILLLCITPVLLFTQMRLMRPQIASTSNAVQ